MRYTNGIDHTRFLKEEIMGRRKDKKGKVFRKGESQRSNGTYNYRYTDAKGNRQSIYAKTLEELRQKEIEIQKDIIDGINNGGKITVFELVKRYMDLRRDLKHNTLRAYSTVINKLEHSSFSKQKIKDVKKSDALRFFISLHDEGLKRNTIALYHNILRPSFEMAVDDDMIRKNPFKFKLSDILPNDMETRTALTKYQQELYLDFIKNAGNGNYYDDIVILLGTGLRVSELYGLTKSDIDFTHKRIYVRRQLCRTANKPYFTTSPKTKNGVRSIPMSEQVWFAFKHAIASRNQPKIEMIVDGHGGFIFLDKEGKPKVAMHLDNYMKQMQKKFIKQYGKIIPNVTPHVLRHTFCSNLANAGIDAKSLQTIMGHSNISVTYDVYTHTDYEAVETAFFKAAANI